MQECRSLVSSSFEDQAEIVGTASAPPQSVNRYQAVLLDVDGTLIDSNDAHAQAWVDAFAEAGHTVPFDRVRPLIGKGADKVLPELVSLSADSPEGERITKR